MSPQLPGAETLLLKQPTISADHLAFVYAGDLWLADADGSSPRRLTAEPGQKMAPHFSPDGQWIAFSGSYDGALSVYAVPVAGGSPRRLTFHAGDMVRGWTPDGRVLFSSDRDAFAGRARRMHTVGLDAGLPEALPMPIAERAAASPDGRRLAYTAYLESFWTWKRYRGGMTVPIWVLDLETLEQTEVPHENASDTFPCWVGETLFFLSDRAGAMNLFRADPGGGVTQLTRHEDYDIRSLTAGAGRLAYEQGGRLHLFDPAAGEGRALSVSITADLPATRRHFVRAAPAVESCAISPTGARALFAARGEILSAPASKGDVRNLTETPGVAERDPAWSPDGQSVAFFSDASGEYQLVVADQKGQGQRAYPLAASPTFYYRPLWSPDGRRIAFTDKALGLHYLEVEGGAVVHVDTDTYDHPVRSLDPAWSPDGKWLAYTKRLPSHLRAVFLYEVASGQSHQVSDGMSDATSAAFSRDGKLLYFAASVNYGLNTGWLDMSSYQRPVHRSLYAAVLGKGEPSPLAPESDEEAPKPAEGGEKKDEAGEKKDELPEVRVDLEGIGQRIVSLPVPAGDYFRLQSAEGRLLYMQSPPDQWVNPLEDAGGRVLHAYDEKERKSAVFLEKVSDYWVSADGKKLLYQAGQPAAWAIVDVAKPPSPGEGRVSLDAAEVAVEPRAEWEQIYREACRLQRDFFYDAELHGLDWAAACERYRAFLPHVGHRDDLNYLLAELCGEIVAGHIFVGAGEMPSAPPVAPGLLGADYEVDSGRYRVRRIYAGLNWHPELRAPLTEPGVDVREGEYILAVNGRPLTADENIFRRFEQTADRRVELLVGPSADGEGARTVAVRPVASEAGLRHWAWVESNRRLVDRLSGGRVAYVYMANTAQEGYDSFNRYYFAQLDKQAVVLDERFNGGGSAADYIIDMLDRPLLSHWATREGEPFTSPNASIFGPKVMVINELAGSGGDAMPLFFRRRGLGKLVGKRTWGGLIGIYDYPRFVDGGFLTAPRLAIYSPDGEWEVENEGVPPDVEVELTAKDWAAGRDGQLERAVAVVLAELEATPAPRRPRPAPARRAIR